jgi:hypothetical protein
MKCMIFPHRVEELDPAEIMESLLNHRSETGWEGDEAAERRFFDEAQELLKQDAEAYWKFLIELDRELNQTEREDA